MVGHLELHVNNKCPGISLLYQVVSLARFHNSTDFGSVNCQPLTTDKKLYYTIDTVSHIISTRFVLVRHNWLDRDHDLTRVVEYANIACF